MAPGRSGAYHELMETRAQRRAELEAAISQVENQIATDSVCAFSLGGPASGMTGAVQTLRKTLAQLREALANLDSEDA